VCGVDSLCGQDPVDVGDDDTTRTEEMPQV
jgi:hypothetical protein